MAMPHWGGGRDGVAVPHHEAVTPKGLPSLLGGTAVAVTPLCPPPQPHHRPSFPITGDWVAPVA